MPECLDKKAKQLEKQIIGQNAIFAKAPFQSGRSYKFSSTLEGVGNNFDRVIFNFEKVIIKSEIIKMFHPTYGDLRLINILSPSSNQLMFVLEEDIMLERDL